MPRMHPFVALRAMRRLTANPDDTAQAVVVIAALAGNSGRRQLRRFRRSVRGREILRDKRDLYPLLADQERLRALPAGTLGRALGDWFAREQISAQGLAQAAESAQSVLGQPGAAGEDERLFWSRLRNLHDVFHVLCGYDRDLRGEAAVLAFTVPQTRSPGVAYLVWRALSRNGWRSETGRLIRQGFRRGLRAPWLVEQDWEALLQRPIGEVRELLRVGPPPRYEQVRSAAAPAAAAG